MCATALTNKWYPIKKACTFHFHATCKLPTARNLTLKLEQNMTWVLIMLILANSIESKLICSS